MAKAKPESPKSDVILDEDARFGEKAIQAGFVSPSELEECLQLQIQQKKAGKSKIPRIGEILVHKGFMNKQQVVAILKGKATKKAQGRFGEIAIMLDFVDEKQRDQAIKAQNLMRRGGRAALPIGMVMVQEKLISANQILTILSAQGKSIASCSQCNKAFNIENFVPGEFNCSSCEQPLIEVTDLEGAVLSNSPPTRQKVKPLVAYKKGDEFGDLVIRMKLGSNPLGDCYVAHETKKSRDLVIRIVDPVRTLDSGFKKELVEGVKGALKRKHPSLRSPLLVAKKSGYYCIGLEYIRGESLRSYLRRERNLPYGQAILVLRKICQAVEYLHSEKQLHGDIRPSNIILNGQGGGTLLGSGMPAKPKEMFHFFRKDQEIPGFYIAPEQVLNAENLDGRADIFALGCTFYHALAGHPACRGRSSVEILDQLQTMGIAPLRNSAATVPHMACQLIERMIAINPEERFQTMGDVLKAVKACPADPSSAVVSVEFGDIRRIEPQESRRILKSEAAPDSKPKKKKLSYKELVEKLKDDDQTADKAQKAKERPTLDQVSKRTRREAQVDALRSSRAVISSRNFFQLIFVLLGVTGLVGAWFYFSASSKVSHVRHQIAQEQEIIEQVEKESTVKKQSFQEEQEKAVQAERLARIQALVDKGMEEFDHNSDVGDWMRISSARQIFLNALEELRSIPTENLPKKGPHKGDLASLAGRLALYQVYISDASSLTGSQRIAKLKEVKRLRKEAINHLKQAVRHFKEKGARTWIRIPVREWMPESYDDLKSSAIIETNDGDIFIQYRKVSESVKDIQQILNQAKSFDR
ncbi:MAG: serine/threonine-protein kinase [Planctomycetota bacterium]|jgi:serine/threonine protein kinase|nr:serine/threonine-protein kinase [Planctomycetota bacterium]